LMVLQLDLVACKHYAIIMRYLTLREFARSPRLPPNR
jgi:hypothetical protein